MRRLFLELHKDELTAYPPNGHHEIQKYFPLPSTVKWETLPNFVLVRNPYTRVLSMFFNKYLHSSWNTIKALFDKNKIILKENSFHNFLTTLKYLKSKGYLNTVDVHLNEQVYNFRKNDLTQIIKLESIDTDLPEAYEKMFPNNPEFLQIVKDTFTGLNTNNKLHNRTLVNTDEFQNETSLESYNFKMGTDTAPPYWKFYGNPKIVDLVYEIYEDDFKVFGYEKDSYPKPK